MIKMESYEYLDETMCDDVSSTEEKYWNNLACEQSKESSSTFDDSFQSDFFNVMSTDAEDYSVEQKTPNPTPKRRGHREKKPEINLDLPYELQQSNRILNELMSDSIKAVNWPFLLDPLPTEAVRNANASGIIKEPMWLNKMRSKLEDGEYQTITQFVADIRLMLQNCFRYYGTNHIISKRGLKLETIVEQKLALLPRELREKTNLAATSGIPDDDLTSPYSTSSSRRRIRYNHSNQSSQILNQLRQEHIEQEREHRKNQVQERKAANEAFYLEVITWEDNLLKEPIISSLKSMWELPQIGLFLYLAQAALNLPEISQFEVERIFLIPRESAAMHSMMTSLLSTPYQRMQLDKKPDMPYKVWHEKLKNKVNHWYKVLHDKGNNTFLTATNLGLDTNMFKVVGMINPFEEKGFHELTYQQRVWIVKSLCDVCCEKETSIQEAINAHPLLDQRSYLLGCDSQDNSYLHFPQFCGPDLRIYKQAPLPILKMPKVKKSEHRKYVSKPIPPPVKKRKPWRKFSTRSKIQNRRPKLNPVIVPAGESESHSDDSETEEESLDPNLEKFSLIVDSVESLRQLIDQFKDDNLKTRKIKEVNHSRCERELHRTLCNILTELEPWEPKLIQATRRARLKIRKEYDDFQKQPPEVEPKEENVWDSEEDKPASDAEFDSDKDEKDASNNSSSLDESELSTLNASNFSPQRKKRTVNKCLVIKKEIKNELLDVSSRGRIRKARKIPNNIENTRPRKSFKLKKPEFEDKNQLEDKPFEFNPVPKAGLEILSQAALSYNPPNPLPKRNLIYQPIANTSNDASKITVPASQKFSPINQIPPKKKNLTYYNYIEHPSPLENQLTQQPSTTIKIDSTKAITKPTVATPKQAKVMSQLQKQGFRVEAGPDGKVLLYVTNSAPSQNQISSNKNPSSVGYANSAPLPGNVNNVTGLQAALAALQAISKPKYANNITVKSLLETSADKQKTNISPIKPITAASNTIQTLASNHENKPPSNFVPSTISNKPLQVYSTPITTNQASCLGSVLISKSEPVSSLPSNVSSNNTNFSLVTVSGVPSSFSNAHARMSASTITTSSTLSAPITTPQVRMSTPTTITQNNMLLKVMPQGISPQTLIIQQNPVTSMSSSTSSMPTVFVGQNVQATAKGPSFGSSPSRFPIVTSPSKMNSLSDNQNLINKLLPPQSFLLQGQNIIGTLIQPSSSTISPSEFNINSPTKGQLSIRLSTPSSTQTTSNAIPFTNSPNLFMSSNTTCPQLVSSVPKAIPSFGITSCNSLAGQQISRSPRNIRKVPSEPPPLQSILGRPVNQSKTVNLNPMVSTSDNLISQGMVPVQNTYKNCMLNQPSGLSLGTLQSHHSISPGGNLINVSTPMQTVTKETTANMRPLLINQPTVQSVLNLGTNTTLMQQGKNFILQQPPVISNNGRETVNAVASANNQTFHVNAANVSSNVPLQTPQNSQKVFLLNIDGRLVAAQGIPMTLNSMGQPTTQIVLSGPPLCHKPTIPTTIVPSRLILTQPVLVQGQQNKMNLPNGSVPGKIVQNSLNSGLIGQPPVLHLSQPAMLANNRQSISTTNTTTVISQRSSQMQQ